LDGDRPQDYKELFNLRHAQARNVIERIFGVCKKRFKVLTVPQEYPLSMQAQLVSALTVIHNFVRIHDPQDIPEDDDENEGGRENDGNGGPPQDAAARDERGRAAERRDVIAKAMWLDYEQRGRCCRV
jgi:hypothetical protein